MSGVVLLILRFLAAITLYAFLGIVFYLLWRILKFDIEALESRQLIPLELSILTPGEKLKNYHADHSPITIGRDVDCDCIINHPTISAHQARLTFHHTQWWIEDLFSTNSTTLNDDPIGQSTVLAVGDIIKCGQVQITVTHTRINNEIRSQNE